MGRGSTLSEAERKDHGVDERGLHGRTDEEFEKGYSQAMAERGVVNQAALVLWTAEGEGVLEVKCPEG